MIIDFHSHTVASDGELIPSELARRAFVNGYTALGFSDHLDFSNFDFVIKGTLIAVRELSRYKDIVVVPGVEITHVPPDDIARIVTEARTAGIVCVIVHGETPVEPVAPLTNLRAIEARVDILAHPGLITPEEVALAKKNNVLLELSGRAGHSFTNGHVASLARDYGARLIIGSDTHSPQNLFSETMHRTIGIGAGLSADEYAGVQQNAKRLLEKFKN